MFTTTGVLPSRPLPYLFYGGGLIPSYFPRRSYWPGYYDGFWRGYGLGVLGAFGYSGGLYSTGFDGYAPYPFDQFGPTGGLRLKVDPKDAAVYVDGYYAGIVDDFDGRFQHLDLIPGPHRVEVIASGYDSLVFDIDIRPHHTTEYRGQLSRSGPF